jgi:hypothetical protein
VPLLQNTYEVNVRRDFEYFSVDGVFSSLLVNEIKPEGIRKMGVHNKKGDRNHPFVIDIQTEEFRSANLLCFCKTGFFDIGLLDIA